MGAGDGPVNRTADMRRRRAAMKDGFTLMLLLVALGATVAPTGTPAAAAAELRILSAGAVEPGLAAAAAAFRRATGREVAIAYATAPMLRTRIGGGEQADVVIAPPPLIAEFAAAGRLAETPPRVPVGRVGVGVAVRADAPAVPVIADAGAFRRAIEAAGTVVFNRASTGLYLEALFERMGLAEAVRAKAVRYPDGAAVMEHLLRGGAGPREIGLGPITEILLVRDRGLRLVGPLPPEVQNHTAYVAAAMAGAADPAGAADFLRFLAGPEARAALDAAGVEAMAE